MSAVYKVMCPKCGGKQLTEPRGLITTARKKCVYCGKSFKIHTHIAKSSTILERVR